MTLRQKLILVFFLLAVIPLTGITIYSYRSSIKAFRKVAEAESEALAEEMGSRMDSVRRDLANRMERLGRFPFRRLMAFSGDRPDPQSNPLMAELMAEMGDTARLLDSIEFSPAAPGLPPGPQARIPAPPPPPAPAKHPPAGQIGPEGLVIRLSPDAPATPAAGRPEVTPDRMVIQVRPEVPGLPPGSARQPAGVERQKMEAQLSRRIQEYQDVLRKMGVSVDEKRIAAQMKSAVEAASRAADQAARLQRANPLASNFGSVVKVDGESVGTVEARVSSRQVFHDVLSRTRRRQGEIPFVIDGEGKLHAISQPDRSKLEALGLPGTPPKIPAQMGVTTLNDWVVVTRKDPGSELAFGIARPTGQASGEIRRTAVRNLGLGLGMVGLALIGIIPLSNRMTRNLATLTQGAEQLARGNLTTRVPVRTRDEIGRLAEAFNRMAHDLSDNQKHLVEQERLRKELEMSRRIQEEMLPRQPLRTGLVEAKGVSIPAREVGGDFFNYFPLPNDEVAVLVGDVSGKGVAAALLMANLQATLHARLPLSPDLAHLAAQLDREIEASTPPEAYLTLFMGILNTKEDQFRYVNAGHHTQYALLSAGGVERMESTGRPLGLLPGGEYSQRHITLSEGDALFLYTDGLVEAEDAAGREFGQQRLEALLSDERTSSINEILTRVEDTVRDHRGAVEAADDATMLVLKIGTSPQSAESL